MSRVTGYKRPAPAGSALAGASSAARGAKRGGGGSSATGGTKRTHAPLLDADDEFEDELPTTTRQSVIERGINSVRSALGGTTVAGLDESRGSSISASATAPQHHPPVAALALPAHTSGYAISAPEYTHGHGYSVDPHPAGFAPLTQAGIPSTPSVPLASWSGMHPSPLVAHQPALRTSVPAPCASDIEGYLWDEHGRYFYFDTDGSRMYWDAATGEHTRVLALARTIPDHSGGPHGAPNIAHASTALEQASCVSDNGGSEHVAIAEPSVAAAQVEAAAMEPHSVLQDISHSEDTGAVPGTVTASIVSAVSLPTRVSLGRTWWTCYITPTLCARLNSFGEAAAAVLDLHMAYEAALAGADSSTFARSEIDYGEDHMLATMRGTSEEVVVARESGKLEHANWLHNDSALPGAVPAKVPTSGVELTTTSAEVARPCGGAAHLPAVIVATPVTVHPNIATSSSYLQNTSVRDVTSAPLSCADLDAVLATLLPRFRCTVCGQRFESTQQQREHVAEHQRCVPAPQASNVDALRAAWVASLQERVRTVSGCGRVVEIAQRSEDTETAGVRLARTWYPSSLDYAGFVKCR